VGITPLMGMLRYATFLQAAQQGDFPGREQDRRGHHLHHELVEHHAKVNPAADIVLSYTRLPPEHNWPGERGRHQLGHDREVRARPP